MWKVGGLLVYRHVLLLAYLFVSVTVPLIIMCIVIQVYATHTSPKLAIKHIPHIRDPAVKELLELIN